MTAQPTTTDEFSAFILYRGPVVEANKARFEEVNDFLVRCFDWLADEELTYNDIFASLDAIQQVLPKIKCKWKRDMASRCIQEIDLSYGYKPTHTEVIKSLMGLRTWLNLAILHGELEPLSFLLFTNEEPTT